MKRLPIKLLWINNCTFIRHTLTMHCLCGAVINISIGLYYHYIHNKLWWCLWCVYISYDTYKTMHITTGIIYPWVTIVKYSPAYLFISPYFTKYSLNRKGYFFVVFWYPKKIWFAHAKSMLLFIHYSKKCCILKLILA